ncbi:MAG TPA: hemerythrin domain-containing protein [Candidatus Limnocylindria bacterium]|nr:hemerythrin domain-containing protein [Candidatus Limnocylindria bacterium]
MRILEEIKRDHDKVRELFLQIDNKEDMGPEIFRTLCAVVLAHHEAEERTVFPQLDRDEDAKELRLELIAEHDMLRRGLQVVLDTDHKDDNWKARVMVCKEMLNHHVEEEEKELFEKLRSKLSENQLNRLYDSFKQVEDEERQHAERQAKEGMVLKPQDHLPKNPMPLGDVVVEMEAARPAGRSAAGSKSGGSKASAAKSGTGKSAGAKSAASKGAGARSSGAKGAGGAAKASSSRGSKKQG